MSRRKEEDDTPYSRSWSGQVHLSVEEDGEDESSLPRSQQLLVSRALHGRQMGPMRAGGHAGEEQAALTETSPKYWRTSSWGGGGSSPATRSYGSLLGLKQSPPRIPKVLNRRGNKNKKAKHNILDGMIQSEQYGESARRRYMVPSYDEDAIEAPAQGLAVPAPARIVEYSGTGALFDRDVPDFDQFLQDRGDKATSLVWIYVEGPPESALQILARRFHIHPLTQEDVLTTPQRPKLDQYDELLLMITHSPELLEEKHDNYELSLNQVSIFVLYQRNILVSFQEHKTSMKGSWAKRVLDRVRNNVESIREKDLSHLLYAVLDSITDRYFPLLEFYGDRMEELEGALIDDPTPDLIKGITRLKRDLLLIRRNVWPMRECTSRLMILPENAVNKATKTYLRDLQDHLVQVVDIIETYRDVSMSLLDLYLSATNNKMQEVMKTLTIISTIFIPLTFITGVYGMNFEYMPELAWPFSYLTFWVLVIIIIGSQIYYFQRQGWA